MPSIHLCSRLWHLLLWVMLGSMPITTIRGQSRDLPNTSQFKPPISRLWINTYGNIRVSKHLFWIAQTHFRFQETNGTAFVGQVAQVYNRHALSYLFSKRFNLSLGGVLRVNVNTSPEGNERSAVPEWRIWHQYQFAMPFPRLMVYHRIRIEHRWSKGYTPAEPYIFRNRWRYMIRGKIPLNQTKLKPKTLYVAPEVELIMQSGKPVVSSPMEDLRLTATLGYILQPQLTIAGGLMYSQGQELHNGAFFNQKWTLRFHLYFSPDFRRLEKRLPAVH